MSKVHRAEKRKRALQPLAVNTFNANVHGRAAQRKDKDKGASLAKRGQKPGKGNVADQATLAVDDEGAGKKKGGSGIMTVDPFDASTAEEHVVAHTKKKPRTVTFAKKVRLALPLGWARGGLIAVDVFRLK